MKASLSRRLPDTFAKTHPRYQRKSACTGLKTHIREALTIPITSAFTGSTAKGKMPVRRFSTVTSCADHAISATKSANASSRNAAIELTVLRMSATAAIKNAASAP